jgi:hypothetical protein
VYSGTLFRSRAEARWAIFFDLMGWDWDYEPCHYQLGTLNYLPDFYLPCTHTWVEVKGQTFLDAASMGKVASAAAGPHPIPVRDAPYGPAAAVVLVGPLPEPTVGRPVHQVVLPAGPGVAGLHRAVWEANGNVGLVDDKPWMTIPATGAKVTRRPRRERVELILAPAALPAGVFGRGLERAYALASTVRFDDKTGELARTTPGSLRGELGVRRRGRPLGCAA